jgi:hypothetical protein
VKDWRSIKKRHYSSCEAVSMLHLSKGIVVEEFLLEGYRSDVS